MKKSLAAITLGAAVCAVLSGCGGVAATTTPAAAAPAVTASPTPKASAPKVVAPAVVAPSTPDVPSCVNLFDQTGQNIASATYLANTCTMNGGTVDLTGSANTQDGRFITYPNGLTVTLAEVQKMPNSMGSSVTGSGPMESNYSLVRVDLTVTNTGDTPVSLFGLDNSADSFAIMYGAGVTAYSNGGVINTDGPDTLPLITQENKPTMAVPGGREDVFQTFSVPTADLGTMSVMVDPDSTLGYTPYRMTDVNAVMVPFH